VHLLRTKLLGFGMALRRVLLILLDNAIKFTPAHAEVRVKIVAADGRCRVEVHDSGAGIAEEHMNHIFERFYRADTARTSSGFGLGLSIAKAIVEAHHGSIGVIATEGLGSCFYVEFPGKPVEAGIKIDA
jgi:signal transduction histidine kinase